jgi:hypothetical protein
MKKPGVVLELLQENKTIKRNSKSKYGILPKSLYRIEK